MRKYGKRMSPDPISLFAATILAARRLIDMDPDKPSMAKQFFVDRAIEDAAFILEKDRCPMACDCEFIFRQRARLACVDSIAFVSRSIIGSFIPVEKEF